jgi:predicted amidophosphoribosyltransferase
MVDGDDRITVQAVVPYGGRVSELIKALKYDGEVEHARFLGHLLFRHLDRRIERDQVDLVIPNPTYAHRGVRHTELLVAAMASADLERRWTFDDPSNPCLVKVRATVSSHGQDEPGRRRAADAVQRALEVRRPELIRGRRLLVIDDVSTTGQQLRAVARTLRAHGAAEVRGLVAACTGTPEQTTEAPGARPALAIARLEALRQVRPGIDGPSL